VDTPDVQRAYADLVMTLRDLGAVLRPAVAAQYDAPPGGTGSAEGISNPTLDIVSDPRRLALSEEIHRTARSMAASHRQLEAHAQTLRTAFARWEGDKETE
jgi:hypothetical protein